MGGKQHIPWEVPKEVLEYTPMDAPVNTPKYKRFCSVCKRQTYDWVCCGQRTRNANFGQTIKDVVLFQSREEDKP